MEDAATAENISNLYLAMDPSSKTIIGWTDCNKSAFRNMLKEELEVIRQEVGDTRFEQGRF